MLHVIYFNVFSVKDLNHMHSRHTLEFSSEDIKRTQRFKTVQYNSGLKLIKLFDN